MFDKQYQEWLNRYGIDVANQLRDRYETSQVKVDSRARNPSSYKINKIKAEKRKHFKSMHKYIKNRIYHLLREKDLVPKSVLRSKSIRRFLPQIANTYIESKKDDVSFSDNELYGIAALIQKQYISNKKS